MQTLIDATPAYNDGMWLWVRIPEATAEDVLLLLTIKRRPAGKEQLPRGFP